MGIQIDDAGWGCLMGPVFLGIYREETQEYSFKEIPVEVFQGGSMARKEYLQAAYGITGQLLEELKVGKEEHITVCTGEVLQGVRDYLADYRFKWTAGKITGPLQVLVETTLLQKLNGLGLKLDFKTLTEQQGLLFWHCVRWLKGGNLKGKALPERERLCKTGWKTFRLWADLPYEEAKAASKRLKAEQRKERLLQLKYGY
jgi:hypothetical protein